MDDESRFSKPYLDDKDKNVGRPGDPSVRDAGCQPSDLFSGAKRYQHDSLRIRSSSTAACLVKSDRSVACEHGIFSMTFKFLISSSRELELAHSTPSPGKPTASFSSVLKSNRLWRRKKDCW